MPATRRRRARLVISGVLLTLVALVAVGVWMALGALTAYDRLSAARDDIAGLQQDVTDGNVRGVDRRVQSLQGDTAEARNALDTWAWRLAEHIPFLGDDVTALRTVVTVVDDLATGPAPDLGRAATMLTADALRPQDGRIPLAPIRRAAPSVTQGYDGLVTARRDLRATDTSGVAGPIADAVGQLRTEVAGLVDRVELADRLVTLLPAMLGGDGPRSYLLVNQNNAEARALGGIVGAATILTAEDGRIRLGRTVAGNSFGALDEPVLPLTPAELTLYSSGLGRYLLNAANTPDFPRAAQLAAARWERDTGQTVAGVISVDPGALALLLRATGPVTVGGVELTAGNATSLLLNEIYARVPDPAAQDAFFASAARAVFDRLAQGRADVRVAASSLRSAADEGRLLIWARRPAEQAEISGFPVAGELDGRSGGRPELGVYLFETTASKLSYYEDVAVTTRPVCGNPLTSDVTVRLTSTVPRSRAARDALPDYVVAGGSPRGTLSTRVLLYAPPGYAFEPAELDGEPVGVKSVVHDGLWAIAVDVTVRPGRDRSISTALRPVESDAAAVRELAVRHTPPARNKQFTYRALECR